ncbi:ferric reductase NAD binding domain-containing protein [Suillus clintonianus]|uniref:ferric reductase NAD binding domain-containing protein n=1 Tax=Suillus clintonianus TaxID=1904413 RepID=UPI001B875F81|nr:ferric reductase NAD binding domain-containing protein [Suillus clintonianus]KAG2138460.1 ferric reductase NAD binding domain-containing protein [Suillus clintonianus]
MSSDFSDADITALVHENDTYPEQVWYTIAAFLFVVGCFQWGSLIHSKFARRRHHESDEETATTNAIQYKVSLRRIPLAIINFYRVVAFRWTLEIGQSYTLNMAEVFVTVAYIVLMLIYCFINTTSVEGQKLDIVYWSNRVGMLASSQFPIITALGTKNNLVSLVTGISYDSLNYIHRMMARTCFMLLWVHAAGEVVCFPSFRETLNEDWLRVGITAMVAFSILIIVSLRPIRTEVYEIFFYTHFLGALIFLVGGYYHTKGAFGSYWIWPSFVFWALDRFIRVVRLVVFNHSYFGFKSGSGTMDAVTELLSEDVVRLRLRRPPHFHWSAGQTAYLIMPSVSTLPFEAHPFTIASFDSSLLSTVTTEDQSGSDENHETQDLGSSAPFWKELVFLVNVHGGFTKKLKEVAARKGKVKVFVDGPYGPSPDLGSYDTSVLVAGGSGISYTLPVFLSVIERVRKGKSNCKRVVFIWSIRGAGYVRWIEEALIKAVQLAPPSLTVSIRIFNTGSPSMVENALPMEEDSSLSNPTEKKDTPEQVVTREGSFTSSSLFSLRGVKMESGRSDLDALLKEEVSVASGSMSVSVCGSQGIARAVRHALRFPVSGPSSILSGGPSVTLHVESFGYA